MSKLQVAAWKMPFTDGHNVIEAEIADPGEIIGNFVHHDPMEATLLDQDGVAKYSAALVVVLRTDPSGVKRLRRFVKINCGQIMEAPDADKLEHRCTFTNPLSGEVTALFEAPV